MDITQTISLALVQGITEFLPVSSSAHLVLLPKLAHWPDQGLAFDVAVHLGTLCAVVVYYRTMLTQMFCSLHRGQINNNMLFLLALASTPILIVGYTMESVIEQQLRNLPAIIAIATISFGLLLWFAAYRASRATATKTSLTPRSALIIGLMQVLALIPGTSRAGITITGGLLLGLPREQSINFSFLLAIPVILLASLYEIVKTNAQPDDGVWPMLILGFTVSAIFAFATIRLFLKLTEKIGFTPFIIYRLVLGTLLLTLLFF